MNRYPKIKLSLLRTIGWNLCTSTWVSSACRSPPLFVNMASDALKLRFGAYSLRYARLLVIITQGWAALHFYLAARTLRGQHEAVCA